LLACDGNWRMGSAGGGLLPRRPAQADAVEPCRDPAFCAIAGALLVLLGALVMLGWWLQIALLVRVLPGYAPMALSTALSFLLAGALLVSLRTLPRRARRRVAIAVG
jgi:hypothetical protein